MKRITAAFVFLSSMLASFQASALTIDFEELATSAVMSQSYPEFGWTGDYVKDGVVISNQPSAGAYTYGPPQFLYYNNSPYGMFLKQNHWNSITTISQANGGTFQLHSLDILSELSISDVGGSTVIVEFLDQSQQPLFGQIVLLQGLGMQSYSLAFAPIDAASVRLTTNNPNSFAIDNLTILSSVPEPSIGMMLLCGGGLIGALARRASRTA